jgi:hypothetical protein
MTKNFMLATLVLGLLILMRRYPLEELVQSVLTIYLLIAGFLIMGMQRSAGELLRPLLLVLGALLIFPPVFRDLVRDLRQALRDAAVSLPTVSIGREWLWVPLAALIVFLLFRILVWYQQRPRPVRPRLHQARERVLPNLDPEDEPRA